MAIHAGTYLRTSSLMFCTPHPHLHQWHACALLLPCRLHSYVPVLPADCAAGLV